MSSGSSLEVPSWSASIINNICFCGEIRTLSGHSSYLKLRVRSLTHISTNFLLSNFKRHLCHLQDIILLKLIAYILCLNKNNSGKIREKKYIKSFPPWLGSRPLFATWLLTTSLIILILKFIVISSGSLSTVRTRFTTCLIFPAFLIITISGSWPTSFAPFCSRITTCTFLSIWTS